jgi:uncharacterized membrane protein YidH (DUF202 family)
MLFHPLLLIVSLALFLLGGVVGFHSAKRRHAQGTKAKSRHSIFMYTAYTLFILSLFVYAYETRSVISLEQKMLFRTTGYLGYHVATILGASTLTSLTMAYGLLHRGSLFKEGVKKKEALHMGLGVLSVTFFFIAVLTGLLMYVKAGIIGL